MILEYATFVEGELDIATWPKDDSTQLQAARTLFCDYGLVYHNLYNSISSRALLSRVSRLWYNLMRSILYRSLIIGTDRTAEKVLSLMGDTPVLASYVKKLDYTCNQFDWSSGEIPEEATEFGVHRFISIFPNLLVLNVYNFDVIFPKCLQPNGRFEEHRLLSNHLQQLTIATFRLRLSDIYVILSSPQLSHLRSLALMGNPLADEGEIEPIDISLPYLEILDVSAVKDYGLLDDFFDHCSLPRLHALTVTSDWSISDNIGAASIWRQFGSQIRTLSIHREPPPPPFSQIQWIGFSPLSKIIADQLPNVQQLIMECIPEAFIFSTTALGKSVRTFELNLKDGRQCEPNPFKVDLKSALSNMKAIRISNIPSVDDCGSDRSAFLNLALLCTDHESFESFIERSPVEMIYKDGSLVTSIDELWPILEYGNEIWLSD
jgi:hypothetical protein